MQAFDKIPIVVSDAITVKIVRTYGRNDERTFKLSKLTE